MGDVVAVTKTLSVPAQASRASAILQIWWLDLDSGTLPESARSDRDVAVAAIKSGEAAALAAALGAPADNRAVGMAVAELIASFPQDKKNDLRTFSRLMAEDVAAAHPSVAALEMACRGLRRRATFLPSIAEVLTEVEAQMGACATQASLLTRLGRRVAEVDRMLPPAASAPLGGA